MIRTNRLFNWKLPEIKVFLGAYCIGIFLGLNPFLTDLLPALPALYADLARVEMRIQVPTLAAALLGAISRFAWNHVQFIIGLLPKARHTQNQ